MSLADDVAELEESYEAVRAELRNAEDRCVDMEQQLDEVEGELEDVTNQLTKFKEFRAWVELAYPVVVKDYESVKLIEEIANEHS
jgi:predicted  nucleic acid-binding Zn-ribbon protein